MYHYSLQFGQMIRLSIKVERNIETYIYPPYFVILGSSKHIEHIDHIEPSIKKCMCEAECKVCSGE